MVRASDAERTGTPDERAPVATTAESLEALHRQAERELARIVEYARFRVEETSLRTVAKEIGISPTGLRGVLNGTQVYTRTRVRLRAWFAWQKGPGELDPASAGNMVLSLVRRLPEPHAAAAEVLELLGRLHQRARMETPAWVDVVRRQLPPRSRGRTKGGAGADGIGAGVVGV